MKNLFLRCLFSTITTFWQEVKKTPSLFKPQEPIVHLGVVVSPNATEFQRSIFLGCTSPEKFAQEFFATPLQPFLIWVQVLVQIALQWLEMGAM